MRAAEELNYIGNPAARTLRISRTNTIAIVVPNISNPFFALFVNQLEILLAVEGFNLLLCDSQNDAKVEAHRLKALQTGLVDAILISPVHASYSLPALKEASKRVPIIQFDRKVEGHKFHWIGFDDANAMELIAAHLEDYGTRVAAYAGSTEGSSSGKLRATHIIKKSAAYGIEIPELLVFNGEFSISWGREVAHKIAIMKKIPDAIICSSDIIAIGLMSELLNLGVSIPKDLKITGIDDIDFASLSSPTLTTVRQPIKEMAEKLIEMIRENQITAKEAIEVKFKGKLIERASTGLRKNLTV
jgi:LacI family transcriptional regulator